VWVADTGNHAIRRIDPATGAVHNLIGGNAHAGAADGPIESATLTAPWSLVVDGDGILYLGEKDGGVRRIVVN
jgi:streptogramin lyase